MDLLAKLKNRLTQSIAISPINFADESPTDFTPVEELISSLLMKELSEFGLSVIGSNNTKEITDLLLDTKISYYRNRYLINCYIKKSDSKYIEAMAQTFLPVILLEPSKDGIRITN